MKNEDRRPGMGLAQHGHATRCRTPLIRKGRTTVRKIRIILVSLTALAAMGLGAYVQPALAFHAGATLKCGSAGTFTIRAQQTGAGPEAPFPGNLILLEEGGVLTVFKFTQNGQVLFDINETGRAKNNVDEITCTFAHLRGGEIEITGILTR
jgi:hypothetical protein